MSKGGGGGSMQGGYGQPRVPINQSGMYSQAGRMNPIGRDYGLTQRSNMGGKGGMPSPYARPPMMQPPRMGGFQPMMQPPRFGGFQGSYTPSNPYFNNTGISGNRSLPQPMSELRRERPFENPMFSSNLDTRMSQPIDPFGQQRGTPRFASNISQPDNMKRFTGPVSQGPFGRGGTGSEIVARQAQTPQQPTVMPPRRNVTNQVTGMRSDDSVFAGGPNFRQLNQPNNQTRALESALNSPSANQNLEIGTGVSASDVPSFDPSYNSGVAGGMQEYDGSYTAPQGGGFATTGQEFFRNQPRQTLPNRFQQQPMPSRGNAKGGFSQPSMGGYPSQPFMGGMGSMGGKGGRMAPPAQSGLNRGRSGFGGKGGQPQQPQVTSEDITKIIDARLRDFQPQAYDDSALREMIQNNQSAIGNISQYDDSGIRSLIDANTQAIESQQTSGYDDSGIRDLISGNQEAIANMPRYEAPDLSGFATTEDLNTRLSGIPAYDDTQLRQDINSRFETFNPNFDVPDFSNFVTSSDLDNRFSNFTPDVSMPDLSGFATTEDINQRFANIPTYDDSQLREDINSRFSNFNPSFDMPDLSGFATTEDINQRFSNFTPSAPDLSGFATTEDINQRFANLPSYEAPDLSGFATTEDINQRFSSIPTYDDTQLRQDINQRFSNFNPNVDLSNYATTQDLSSAISGLPSYEAPDLSGFVTQDDLSSGLNSIGGYDDTQLRQDINQRFSDFNPNVDLSNYATTADLTSAISDIPQFDASSLQSQIEANQEAIGGFTPTDLSNYATLDQLSEGIGGIQAPDLSGFATKEQLSGLRGNVFDNISRQGNRGQLDPSLYSDEGLGTRFSDNYANVGFMNQMSEQNAQVDSEGNSIFPTFSYDPKTNEYVRDSSAFGLTGDSAITRYSPEDFFAEYGRTLGKMPSGNNNQNPQDAGTGNTDNPDLYDDSNVKGNEKEKEKGNTLQQQQEKDRGGI